MEQIKLTELVRNAGCAAKIGPDVLSKVLGQMPKNNDENLMVGIETSDDAAVYRINEHTAMIQTLDFFTPMVDDPYLYGQIAAANAISDVYAMGGEPKLAMNISCFPRELPEDVMRDILRGGWDKAQEAGVMIVGGHTIDDVEPKYGMAVTGFVHPDQVLTNCNAKPGDTLILTKSLGIGILNVAYKGKMIEEQAYQKALDSMKTLNKYAKDAMMKVGVHSCTDVTGFSLLGHGLEMAQGSNVSLHFIADQIPIIEDALTMAKMGMIPRGAYNNKRFIGDKVKIHQNISQEVEACLFDPQTSGGLLIAVSSEKAEWLMEELKICPTPYRIIGTAVEREEYAIRVL